VRRKFKTALFVATLAVYAVMVFWSLPKISDAAGGLMPFDLRPAGYDLEAARAFIKALDAEGARFYLEVQHRLDMVYPALLAASLIVALIWAWRGAPRWVPALACAAAVIGAGADYAENWAVAGMISGGVDGLTTEIVDWASRASRTKAVLTTVAMVVLLVGLVLRFLKRWRG